MAAPKSVIHINFVAGALFFDPRHVWTALRNAERRGAIQTNAATGLESKFGNLALHLGTRNYMIRRAVNEVKAALTEIYNQVPEPWSLPERHGYKVIGGQAAEDARDRVLLATDAFLFELRAYLDLLARFADGIRVGIRKPPPARHVHGGKQLKITSDGRLFPHSLLLWFCDTLAVPTDWYAFLVSHRNFFTHDGAPYCAIEDRLMRPPEFDLLIMRINIHDFRQANPGDYFRVSECQAVVKGVRLPSAAIERHLIALLQP